MAMSRDTEVLVEWSEQLQQRSSDLLADMSTQAEVRQAVYESNKREMERITQEDNDLILTCRPSR